MLDDVEIKLIIELKTQIICYFHKKNVVGITNICLLTRIKKIEHFYSPWFLNLQVVRTIPKRANCKTLERTVPL